MTLPLSAPMLDLLVLSVIAEEDAYGYQIGRIIKRASATMKDSALEDFTSEKQDYILTKLDNDSAVVVYESRYSDLTDIQA